MSTTSSAPEPRPRKAEGTTHLGSSAVVDEPRTDAFERVHA